MTVAAEKWEEQRAADLRRLQSSEPELEAPEGTEPFDLSAASVAEMLGTEAPERAWLVLDRLPLGVVGLLAAAGSTGKSMAILQLAVSCCTGEPWFGMAQGRSGSALILSAEDDRDEIHRRVRIVASHYRMMAGERAESVDELIAERLFILDRVGEDNRLTRMEGRELVSTAMAERIIRTAEQMPGPVLIVLDPLSRFDGGDGNDNGDGTRLIEAAERIRKGTGCTVLMPHHVSKAGIRDPESGQEAVRGASGLVDGARWVGMLATLRRDDARKYGIEPRNAGRYVRFTTPKANYAAPSDEMLLERQAGGVLVATEMQKVSPARAGAKAEDRFDEIAPVLVDLVRQRKAAGTPLTQRQLREYAGKSGRFAVGEQTLRTIVRRAIDTGLITEVCEDGKRYAHLAAR